MTTQEHGIDIDVSGWEGEGGAVARDDFESVQAPQAFAPAEVGVSAPPVPEIGTVSGGLARVIGLGAERPPHDGMDTDGAPIYH